MTPESDSLAFAGTVSLRDPSGDVTSHKVVRVSPHKGNVLLRVEGVESAETAEPLVGVTVLMPVADLPQLPEGEYYWHQLEGLTVVDRSHGEIGRLEGMFTTAAHDIYEVQGPFGEVLIPVVDRFILQVDLDEKRMQVDLPEGLVPENDDV